MKPFAILMLSDLRLRTFDHRDDWQTACESLLASGTVFIPLKFNAQAGTYAVQEIETARAA